MYDDQEIKIEKQKIDLDCDFAIVEKQEARAFLRERFLRVITGVVGNQCINDQLIKEKIIGFQYFFIPEGKQAEFNMYEKTKVFAEFRGCDTECLEIFVRNLTTPLGKIPEAILRTTDIIHFEIEGLSLPDSG